MYYLNINTLPKYIYYFYLFENDINYYNIKININNMSSFFYILITNYNTQSNLFSDLLVSDYPNYIMRFLSIYNVISLVYNIRYIIKVLVSTNLIVESITNLYSCSS